MVAVQCVILMGCLLMFSLIWMCFNVWHLVPSSQVDSVEGKKEWIKIS